MRTWRDWARSHLLICVPCPLQSSLLAVYFRPNTLITQRHPDTRVKGEKKYEFKDRCPRAQQRSNLYTALFNFGWGVFLTVNDRISYKELHAAKDNNLGDFFVRRITRERHLFHFLCVSLFSISRARFKLLNNNFSSRDKFILCSLY